jgi:hypothetical protein
MELVVQLVLLILFPSIVTVAPILTPRGRISWPSLGGTWWTLTRLSDKVAHDEPDGGIHRGARHLGKRTSAQ